jgi:hypothetical protein
MANKSPYYDSIKALVDPKYNPRHVEAYMRVANSCLDGLSHSEFTEEVKWSCFCIDEQGKRNAERVAKSFGL